MLSSIAKDNDDDDNSLELYFEFFLFHVNIDLYVARIGCE